MALTNFPGGITSMGVPVLGGEGLMSQGKSYFVDPRIGSDGNSGLSVTQAFASIGKGEDSLTANQNDVLYYMAGSSSNTLTELMVWDKSYTHLVGVSAPVTVANRARIFQTSTVTGTPNWTVSATGASFRNIYIFHGIANAAALVNVSVTGGRNYFENVHFAGIGDATQDAAGAASLALIGAEENVFKHCVIGLDTQGTRTGNSSELLVDTLATRNYFEDCRFIAWISAAGHHLVRLADNAAVERYLWFKNCGFAILSTNNATAATEVFDIPSGGATQYIFLENCAGLGKCTDWDAANDGRLYNTGPVTTADAGTAGISAAT